MTPATLQALVSNALLYGLALSALMSVTVFAVGMLNPEIMLRDYPPDIQAKYGPMSDRTKRMRLPLGILILLLLLGVVAISLRPVFASVDAPHRFVPVFTHLLIMFTLFNVFDWLVLDWLIVVTIRPKFIVLPGTEGLPGYSDYGFHFRGFLIGIPITLLSSLLIAGVASLLP